ncbi:MAG TPA: nitrile hydratase subunit alpha [Geminicoccaceae bacterium]|nr:nitrile hydratase subunit alpha [Geminicoccaceae bacterium]
MSVSHDHAHGHRHDDGHRHPFQPDIEDRPFEYYQVMAEAVGELLIDKGVLSAAELRRAIEDLDSRNPALGARVVARAWVDPAFKARLLDDVNAAAGELGIDAGSIPIRAVENTARLHHVICCTLCSCYPRLLLGVPPDWYKSRAYRSRVVREPRAVLAEFGTHLPADVEVRVHDSTADLRYIVLPMRPTGSEALAEAQLAALVTRDCMIGTALPRLPDAPRQE